MRICLIYLLYGLVLWSSGRVCDFQWQVKGVTLTPSTASIEQVANLHVLGPTQLSVTGNEQLLAWCWLLDESLILADCDCRYVCMLHWRSLSITAGKRRSRNAHSLCLWTATCETIAEGCWSTVLSPVSSISTFNCHNCTSCW